MSADANPPTDGPLAASGTPGADETPDSAAAKPQPAIPPVRCDAVWQPIEAQLVDPPARRRLPQPNLLVAALLATLPMLVQFGLSAAIIAAGVVVLSSAHGRVESPQEVVDAVNQLLLPLATVSNLLVALAVVGVAFRRQTGRRIAWRNCSAPQWLLTLLLVIPLAVLASEVGNLATGVLSQFEPAWLEEFRHSSSELLEGFARQPWWLVFISVCLLPGIGEEIYCRGLISRGLVARYGVWAGTLFASFIFGAMHLEPIQASSAFALGLALQYVFLATRSLIAPIALHTLNNFAAFLVMRFDQHIYIPGLSPAPDGGIVHTPPLLLAAALLAMVVLSAVLFRMRTRWLLPDGEAWSPGYITAESPPAEVGARAVSQRPRGALIALTLVVYLVFLGVLFAASQPPRALESGTNARATTAGPVITASCTPCASPASRRP